MVYSRLRITEKIVYSKEALSIALNDSVVAEALARFGITKERLSNGLLMQEDVQQLENNRQAGYAKRLEATATADALYKEVLAAFRVDRRIVLALVRKKPGFADRLRINSRIENRRDAFLFQVQAFYGEMLADAELRAELEPYIITKALLRERVTLVDALADALHQQQLLTGVSVVATKQRKEALANLDSYMAEFIGVARIAFRADKEQLEKLGLR